MRASTPHRTSLRDFVKANDSLLAAFGVFAGLSAALVELHDTVIAYVSFALASLLLWEVLNYAPEEERRPSSLSCYGFKVGIILLMIGLSGYVAEGSLTFALSHLQLVSTGVVFVPLYVLARFMLDIVDTKTGLLKKISSNRASRIAVTFLVGFFLIIVYYLSEYIVSLFRM